MNSDSSRGRGGCTSSFSGSHGSSQSVQSITSLLGGPFPPPRTPSSNFNIMEPEFSSSSSSNGGSDDDDREDIFPSGFRTGRGSTLHEITHRRLNDSAMPSNNNGIEAGSSSSNHVSENIFGENGSVHSAAIRRRRQLLEGRAYEGSKDIVMCFLWAGGRLAASYYDLETGQIFMLPDILDSPPDFDILRSAYNQVRPSYVLVNKSSDDRFMKVINELTGQTLPNGLRLDQMEDNDNNSSVDSVNLFSLASKEFAPDICKRRVLCIKLPYESKHNGDAEHNLFITSLIPFVNENLIRTLGCLLKFMDKSAIELFQIELTKGVVHVVDVHLFKMDDLVLVDDTAWKSLQIFNTDIHPSSFKQGNASSCKEGLSVFSILNQCVTTQGSKKLRTMLLRPSRNKEVLRGRYDVIDYCLKTENIELVRSVSDSLKSVKSIPKLLYRLSQLHATVTEWKDMYNSLYHCLLIGEICGSLERVPQLMNNAANPEFISTLRTLTQEMLRLIDFEQSSTVSRIVAREGLDEELDRKKRQYACLPEIMSIVASEEIAELPQYVEQCCAVYIPEVGYLLAVTIWQKDLSDEELNIPSLEFRFKTQELAYYKSPRMRELDQVLGDCSIAILEKETLIMVGLTEQILNHSSTLLKICDLISEIDSLIAMANLSNTYNFVRPILVPAGDQLRIVDGWHPLSDLLCQFVRNTTMFGDQQRVVVITGPNASGKSVYLKQVGIVVLMALSGCFVPASHAQIPLFDRICTRIHAVESVSTGFSTFMVDVNQMSLAIRSSTKNSLIIIDEFGKGTSEADGISLLTASIQDFIDKGEHCPTIFLSTHFYSMIKHLKPSLLLKYQTMKFIEENGAITYLFELVDGQCKKSFATLLAKLQGVPDPVIERMVEVEKVTTRETDVPIDPKKGTQQQSLENLMVSIGEEFKQINFNEINPIDYLMSIKRKINALQALKDDPDASS